MNRMITTILAVCMVFGMTACSTKETSAPATDNTTTTTTVVQFTGDNDGQTTTAGKESAETKEQGSTGDQTTGTSADGTKKTAGSKTAGTTTEKKATNKTTTTTAKKTTTTTAKQAVKKTTTTAKKKTTATTKKKTTTKKATTTTKASAKYMTIKEIEDYGNNLLRQAGIYVDYNMKPNNCSWYAPCEFAIDDKAEKNAEDKGLAIWTYTPDEMINQLNVEISATLTGCDLVKMSADETNWLQNLTYDRSKYDGSSYDTARCKARVYCEHHPEYGEGVYWLYVFYG